MDDFPSNGFDSGALSETRSVDEIESKLNAEDEAKVKYIEAKTKDQKQLTKLKKHYAGSVMVFLWYWFGALIFLILTYVSYQIGTDKDIPKEVIISAFTSTAVIAGLVGYIVKGLFGEK